MIELGSLSGCVTVRLIDRLIDMLFDLGELFSDCVEAFLGGNGGAFGWLIDWLIDRIDVDLDGDDGAVDLPSGRGGTPGFITVMIESQVNSRLTTSKSLSP